MQPYLRRWSQALAGYALAGGMVSLAGWVFDVPRLTDWTGYGISIQPNTCFAVLFASAAALALTAGRFRVAGVCGGIVAFIGGATLLEWISGLDFGIDTLFMFGRTWGRVGVVFPGRMGPPGATSWTLLGVGLLLASRGARQRRFVPALALVTLALSLLSLVGYAYGASILYTLPRLTVIAMQTSTFIFALSLALVLSVPERSPASRLVEAGAAGALVRRAVPVLVLLPIALGFLRLVGQRAHLYDLEFGTALRTVVEIILMLALLWWTASTIRAQARRAERQRLAGQTNEERLAGLLGSMSDAFMTFDASWRFTFVNDEAEVLLRQPRSELIGRTLWAMYPDAVGTEFDIRLRQAMDARITVDYELFYEPWQRWFYSKAYPMGDGGLALFSRDVTERRRVSESLRRTEQDVRDRERLLAAVTENTKVGLVVVSPEHRYLYANHAYGEILGLTQRELVGRAVADMVPQAYDDQIKPRLEKAFRGERVAYDLVLEDKAYSVVYEPQMERGLVVNVIVTVADITERKRIEEELKRTGEMKDEFLSTLSHELRTPLHAILGWVRVLEKRPSDPALAREGIEVISRNAKAQADLISDLLDMSRIISGKIRLETEDVTLSEVIGKAIDTVRPAAEGKRLHLTTSLDPGADAVRGDASRLQQVLWNLLSNAVKFTPKDGRVDVELRKAESQAEIVVSDSGAGIAARFLPHVFDRFRQGDASTTREHGGLGLGLAIVKQLVELHGGTVRADSDGEGKGAAFTIRLPLALMRVGRTGEGAATAGGARRGEDVDLEGITILAVEDQADARELLRIVLERSRARVLTAASADEALRMLEKAKPAIILCDIGMPGKDGYDFIAELRRRKDDTPALAVTAFARAEDKIRALRAGYHGHIAKPIEPAELLSTVAVLAKAKH